MPTDVKIQFTVPGVTAKNYYRVALADADLARRFHAEVNHDPNAMVGSWEGGRRSVSFHMTLNVPAMIKKIIGTDHIRVDEVTCITWKGDSCFELVTEPTLDFPGANKFTTHGCTVVSDTPEGCMIDCTLRCSAALPWPMQGSVEGVMANEGRVTVSRYLEYTKQACMEDLNNRAGGAGAAGAGAALREGAAVLGAAARAPPPLEAAPPAAAAGEEDEDAWYDFEEDLDEAEGGLGRAASGAGTGPSARESSEAGALAVYQPLGRDEVAVRCLLQIQKSCSETAVAMQQALAVLQRMDANIAAIHDAAVTQARPAPLGASRKAPGAPSAAAAGQAAAAVRGSKAEPSQLQAKSPSSYTYTYLACLCLAGASLASVAYLRAKQRGSASSS